MYTSLVFATKKKKSLVTIAQHTQISVLNSITEVKPYMEFILFSYFHTYDLNKILRK